MVEYCNLTTDLQNVFSGIEDFAGFEVIEDFTASGDNYLKNGTGSTSIVREDELKLTSASNTSLSVGEFYYDSSNDVLYIRCSDDEAPSTHEIEINSQDWNGIKTWARQVASGQVEAMLNPQFPRPIPVSKLDFDYTGNLYDPDVMKSVATMTVANIIERVEPENPLVEVFRKKIWNPPEDSGVMWDYRQGRKAFSFQTTIDEYYGNIIPVSESSAGRIQVRGNYRGTESYVLRIKISTAGAVETAEFDVSDDNGRSYFTTGMTTYNQFQRIYDGIFVKFEGTFEVGDEWKITIADSMENNDSMIGAVLLERN